MSRSAKRIVGNISVLAVIVALVAALVVSAANPTLLNSDAKLTAEANAGTPIVQAAPEAKSDEDLSPSPDDPQVKYKGATASLAKWAEKKHQQWVDFYLRKDETGFVGSSYSIYIPTSDGGYMWARNLSWNAPSEGELEITVKGSNWTEADLKSVGGYVMEVLGSRDSSLKSVTAISEDGLTSVASTGSDV
ncbi:hypothetical protein AOZ07_03155 [Glutamicibacter halophytocola]|uniref:hypothetical protein n=1 Tax=Glutamicibacter halophytocola TaxID=1933880 RepID=UPI0006D4A2AA|nr:hypothetical protein [Glutamicibacter halophytocola]ALG28097.1 hypothetical protein AOZ07_03155 [Glutamicibacter halophytocola]